MVKVVITRNFKGDTKAKYCMAKYVENPSTAKEIEEIDAKNVQFKSTKSNENLKGFEDWGCGVVAVAEVDESYFQNQEIETEFVRRGPGRNLGRNQDQDF